MQVEVRNYEDIGQYLREVRESRELMIPAIAQHLNIRGKYLVALEEGDLSVMPGKVYARGYLRHYAEYLGLNADEIAEAFDHLELGGEELPHFVPEPTSTGYQPGMLMVGAALVSVLLIYLYWYSTHKETLSPPRHELVSPVPERLINPLGGMMDDMSADAEMSESAPADETMEGQPDAEPQADKPARKIIKDMPWLKSGSDE